MGHDSTVRNGTFSSHGKLINAGRVSSNGCKSKNAKAKGSSGKSGRKKWKK